MLPQLDNVVIGISSIVVGCTDKIILKAAFQWKIIFIWRITRLG